MVNEYKILPIVYCIDTEGPLHETVEATFERVESIFGVQIEPTIGNYRELREGTLGDKFGLDFSQIFNETTLNYNKTMADVDKMLLEILPNSFRRKFLDSFNEEWIYNWFCVAHTGIKDNPRQKTLGTHAIFDKYQKLLGQNDSVHFHYHPLTASRNASHNGTTWILGESNLIEILCKRVIEREWFPAFNRPGFHLTRPDSHWFLEQYIPFDFANQSLLPTNGSHPLDYRLGDWRRAPVSWVPFHPAQDDWQIPGHCKRTVARCLNVGTRHSLLTLDEVKLAFKEVSQGDRAILAFTNQKTENRLLTRMNPTNKVAKEFPNVKFKYMKPQNAFFPGLAKLKLKFDIRLSGTELYISADNPSFGIQPFFCYQTIDGIFRYDNLQINNPNFDWQYTFSDHTINLAKVKKIGIAANTNHGVTTVSVIDVHTNKISESYHNES